jgi:integrase
MRPYDLRHLFVSLLISEGRSIVDVAAQAGHAPSLSYDTYGHILYGLEPTENRPDIHVDYTSRSEPAAIIEAVGRAL